jgi:hypothetical protein
MTNIIDIDHENVTFYNFQNDYNIIYTNLSNSLWNDHRVYFPDVYPVSIAKYASVSTDQFYALKTNISSDHYNPHLYPIAVRYVSNDGTYVIERPPFQIEVDFKPATARTQAEKIPPIKIWVPWTVAYLKLDSLAETSLSSMRLYFNDGPISSLDDILIPSFLPNSYSNGNICFSNSMSDYYEVLDEDLLRKSDIQYIYNYIFNNYMMGGWNCDLSSYFFNYIRLGSGDSDKNTYPHIYNYANPSKETKEKAIESFTGSVYQKTVKSILRRTSHVYNFSKSTDQFLRHMALLSTYSLDDTLSLISNIKSLYEKNKNYMKSYHIRSVQNNIEVDSSSNFSITNAATTILNSLDLTPEYSSDLYSGHVVIDRKIESTYHADGTIASPVKFFTRSIPTQTLAKVHDLILDLIKNNHLVDKQFVIFINRSDESTYNVSVSHQSLTELVFSYVDHIDSQSFCSDDTKTTITAALSI